MALPQAGANTVGVQVYPIADLGLSSTVTSTVDVTSVSFYTAAAANMVLVSQLASGSGNIYWDIADTPADLVLTSGGASLDCALSGTATQTFFLQTTVSQNCVGMKQHTASSMVFTDLLLLVLYNVQQGLEAGSIKHSINAVMNTTMTTTPGSGLTYSPSDGTFSYAIQ